MNIKRGKSLIAFVLVFAMLLTMIPIKNRVMAAETGTATLKFVSATTGGTFKFKGTLADGSVLPGGDAVYYKIPAIIDGAEETWDILMQVYADGSISIWNSFFQYNNSAANKQPSQSLKFEKGATLTQVQLSGRWSEVEGGNTYTLNQALSIECNESGAWEVSKEKVALGFVSATTGGTFKFKGTLADGSALPGGDAVYYKIPAIIDGADGTWDILMQVYADGSISIWNSFFQYNNNAANKPPTQSLKFEKGATVTQVQNSGSWSIVEGGHTYALSEELSIQADETGKFDVIKEEVTLKFVSGKVGGTFKFTGKLTDGSYLLGGETSDAPLYYKIPALIDGATESWDILMQVDANGAVSIWNSFFQYNNSAANKPPSQSLKFAEGVTLTQVTNSGSWSVVEGGNTYTLGEELRIEADESGIFDVIREKVTLGFVSGTTGGTFTFAGTFADGSYLPVGNYKVPATIVHDGGSVTKDIVVEVTAQNPERIKIWNSHFNWVPGNGTTPPTKSLTFAKDAIFTPVQHSSGWSIVEDGQTYELSEEISVVNNNGQWMDNSVLEGIVSITLGFGQVTSANAFYFTGALAEGGTLTTGFYKVNATIGTDDGIVTKDVVVQVNSSGTPIIWGNFFNEKPGSNNTLPTKSFTIAENAIFTEVSSSGWGVVEKGQTYKLGKEFSIKKDQFGLWDIDVETTDLGSLAMTLNKVENKHTYLVGTFQNGGTLTSGDYYKGVATIETDSGKETKFITLGIGANNAINIYDGFYTWNNNAGNTPPTKSFKIAAGTTFRQVYANPWREVPADETPTSFTVAMNISIVNEDGTWYEEVIPGDANGDGVTNVCDLVRYVKYNKDSVNTMIATGADINGNSIYDDIDNLRKLLVGEDIPVATYFNLVQNGASDYTIVTPANATTNEVVAANELQYFIQESTGATLTIATETDSLIAGNGKYIYVGNTKAAEEASVTLASSAQKKNGYLIKTVEDDCYLRGYSDIGTKNSVYEFLDHAFDYEFYASDEIYLTKTSNAKLLNYNLETSPDFEWRLAPNGEVIYTANGSFATSTTGVVANRMRFNLASDIFVTKYDFHNGYTILPPATYLEEHPDWYSRDIEDNTITYTSDAGTLPAQLCYSSASMREQFTIELLELLESTTVANVMLGQQDTKYWCECEACSAAKEQYGTNAAVLVQFANAVQADVNTWFVENRPGETPTRMVIFAYQSTSQPAVKWDEQSQTWTAIDEKVILNEDSSVMFAIGDMQMHVPFAETDPSSLSTPYGRILGWEACSDSMFAWTYSLYMNHGLLFSNTIDVMAQNYRLLAEHGVTMIQEQADSYQKYKNSGFSRLETYLMSKMQWDTSLNQEQLIDDFFANYFGEAADTMQTLFNLERKNILAKYEDESIGFKGTFGEDVLTTDFWPQDELEAYQALIQQAYSDIASLEATDAERYARIYERILLESMQFDYIDCSLYNTDIANRNEFKNNFEELGMYSYSEHKSIGSLWKAWGIQYGQVMSYSYTNDANSFNFVLHKGSETGWYQAEAYVDGVLTPVLIEVTGSNSAWIYWHSFNNNNSSNTTKQPTTSLVIRPGTLMKPVVTNSWNQQDMSRPSYKLETQLYITKTENGWVAGDTISAKPTGITMNFEYTSDKNKNGKYDFAFSTNQAITNGWYKADAVIDGKVQSVLLQVIDLSDNSSRVWIYEGCFNDNAKLSDSVLPQSTFVITKGTVLSPVIASKYTVDSERIGYQLTQELNITNTNGKWQ